VLVSSFTERFAKSKKCFFDVVKPCFLQTFGGELLQTENIEHEITQALDLRACIDALWCPAYDSNAVYSVAMRIQYGHCYKTFTIRESTTTGVATEYEKTSNAIKSGTMFPCLTIQAYVDNEQIVGAALAFTKTIYECIEKGLCTRRMNNYDGNSFIAVHWETIQNNGYEIAFFNH
jgi:hypothetical protein